MPCRAADELGYGPLSPTGAIFQFEVFSQRVERGPTHRDLPPAVRRMDRSFCSERLTGALSNRLTHHVHNLEMIGEGYRLKHSRKSGKA